MPECSSVGKLTTAPAQKLQQPTVSAPPSPPPPLLTPVPLVQKLLLTCTISQLVQGESPPAASHAVVIRGGGWREGIGSLTPCVLCLHHFIGRILPQRTLPSAPLVEFSITSHIQDTLWWVPPWGPGQELLP